MRVEGTTRRRAAIAVAGVFLLCGIVLPLAQQSAIETRDPKQAQDEAFARLYREWTGEAKYGSPLVDHLPLVRGIPTPKDVLGYYIGAPQKLTYYADILRFYRALAAATPRVRVETIGRSDEGRELVVVWVSSERNMKALQQNRDNLARIADPRGLTDERIRQLIATTKPHYHLIGGLHSSETGPPEMLMELVYRLAVETSPLIRAIRDNVYVSVTPVAEADGRDRQVDWLYYGLEARPPAGNTSAPTRQATEGPRGERSGQRSEAAAGQRGETRAGQRVEAVAGQRGGQGSGRAGRRGGQAGPSAGTVPYWGRYVSHDNNRDINVSLVETRAITDWYFTAHPPIIHDLHEARPLMYTYSGGPPQNPNLDPLLFAELSWFSNWELTQMTKWGMPGVYTHAFMDGWSPGYLGSIGYNHNGVMKMYETQSGRDALSPAASSDRSTATPPEGRGDQPAGGRGGTSEAGGRGNSLPTGRGGSQDREWYRGLPVPANAAAVFTRRDNTNFQETGILSSLQLVSMFPSVIVENFYVKTRNAIEDGRTKAPYGFVIPVQRDMTKATELVRILRIQGIEVGVAPSPIQLGDTTFPAGSYVIKRDQPYGRLAKNLLEKQVYPDPRLTTYDDSAWTMGLEMLVDVREIADPTILKVPTTPVGAVTTKGKITGSGTAGLAVAHYGSNNMIAFRYRLRNVPMKIAEKNFTADGIEFPAGSFVIAAPSDADVRAAVDDLGLTAAALSALPDVPMHDVVAPRVAIYSEWTRTQDLGWYRLTFDRFGIPYDLIYKEQVRNKDLRARYDVILMAAQNITRQAALEAPAARPQPYQRSDKYGFLGAYGETTDMSGGMGQEGVDAFAEFLEGGGTLIAAGAAVRFPIEFGWTRTVDVEQITGVTAQRPIVQAELLRPEHPVFYGCADKTIPIKYIGNTVFRVGVADQANALARYVGGDSSVLSGLMVGSDSLRQRVFAVDVRSAFNGKGRVILFANNPINRWQNHGEFNMIFNSLLNWDYAP
jgi:hypothetical protein